MWIFPRGDLVATILENVSPLTKHFSHGSLPCTLNNLYEWTIKVEAYLRTTAEYVRQHTPAATDVRPCVNKESLLGATFQSVCKVQGGKRELDVRGSMVRCGNYSVLGHRSETCQKDFVPFGMRTFFKCKGTGHIAKLCSRATRTGYLWEGGGSMLWPLLKLRGMYNSTRITWFT